MILPLKRYAQFSGRARRIEFWMWALFQILVYLALTIALFALFGAGDFMAMRRPGMGVLGGVAAIGGLLFLFWLATLLPNLSVGVRRLHDSNRSGWWLMAWAAPYLVSLLLTAAMISVAGSRGGAAQTLVMALTVCRLVSFVGAIVLLVLYCLPGTRGTNRFGPDPIEAGNARDLGEVFG